MKTLLPALAAALLAIGPVRANPAAASGGPTRAAPSSAAILDAEAGAFVAAWRRAVARPGGHAIADLTAFPFLFESRRLERPGFVAEAVPALFSASARRCLLHARPVPDDERLIVTCSPYGYVMARTADGWRLIEFFVDAP